MATVDTIIDDARSYASSSQTAAAALVNSAQSAISGLGSVFTISGPTIEAIPNVDLGIDVPTFQGVAFETGAEPTDPSGLQNLPSIGQDAVPTLTASVPTFNAPASPSALANFSGTAPTINTNLQFPTLPAELEGITFVAPTLTDRTAPTAPAIVMPTFDATRPTDDITPPTDLAEDFEAAYRNISPTMFAALNAQMDTLITRYNPEYHNQLAALESRLTDYVQGGSALPTAIEDAIYERTKDKVNAETRRARDTAYTEAARRGFTLPDGTLNAALTQARQSGSDNLARAATDIAVKQAELEQQNIQFAITTSTQLRNAALNAALSYHGNLVSLNGQALEYSKAVLQAAVQVYDALVKAYAAKLDAYKAEASVYEARIKGALSLVEVYKAEIGALEALTRVDMAKVDIYKSRIDALNSLAGVYRSRIDAVLGQAQVEKMKIELYGAQVQAYGVQAQAKSAEWSGYSAAVSGQEARFRAYGEEVRAYSARVEAYRALLQARQAQVESVTSYNQGVLAQYVAKVEGYKAKVDARAKVASTEIELQRSQLFAAEAAFKAAESQARITQEYYKTKAMIGVEEFRALATAALEGARLNSHQIEAVAQTALSGAKVYEGLASSALAGMNTLVTKADQE